MNSIKKIDVAAKFIKKHLNKYVLKAGVILGSGLGSFGNEIEEVFSVDTSRIPYWPKSTVEGHKGHIVFSKLEESLIAVVQGRVHLYEGYSLQDVAFGVRVLNSLGIESLVITNAAGSTNPDISPGKIMVISDHINMMGSDPLIGENLDNFGPRFPDMNRAYCREYREIAKSAASELGIDICEGVLAATHGPSYETPAEVKALRLLGADAVCMSTIPEVIAANHMGMKVLGISCITNMASGMSNVPLSHADVENSAHKIADNLNALLRAVLVKIVKKE